MDLAPQADPRAALDRSALLSRGQALLAELEADLLTRARASVPVREALRARHVTERGARRTADPLEVWERHFVTQVAAAWVLSCVFVRTLEDRGLLGHNRIAGPGAMDSQRLFFELAPSLTEREYLLAIFRELSRSPAARDLFDARHNPVWMLGPSAEMAKKILTLFRTPNAETPGLRFGQADTRFLGDLYQDLSTDVRERFALLQTPHFVESYILDRTLERAIARFGLDETTLIDPTCGSGHFLLSAFERLLDYRLRKEPGLDVREAAGKALEAVYGADINPYAVAITRFRLTLSFLSRAGYARLVDAPALPLHLVAADSLLHNPQHPQARLGEVQGQTMKMWGGEEFALEDDAAARDVLHHRFAAVVGNPPYIAPSDQIRKEQYKSMYRSCYREFTLATPFTERFFQLARPGGYVGMITENGFMKRERGRKLIEEFLPTINVEQIINTSGAYIPGHGTPTLLIFGSNEDKKRDTVTTVLARRGEPSTPNDPERGKVWSTIAMHSDEVGFEDEFISVAAIARSTLEKHPWSLGGGGAAELKDVLEARADKRLGDIVSSIGYGAISGEDNVFILPSGTGARQRIDVDHVRPLASGEAVRDWALQPSEEMLWPCTSQGSRLSESAIGDLLKFLWPYRRSLLARKAFGLPIAERGIPWWAVREVYEERFQAPRLLSFAHISTHNHFVLAAGDTQVFNRHAPVIMLGDATEEDHLSLLAYLNSSTVCFWMKQVSHDKGSGTDTGKWQSDRAKIAFEFSGTSLAKLPIPKGLNSNARRTLADLARRISELARLRARIPRLLVNTVREDNVALAVDEARREDNSLLARCVSLQEEVDWIVYCAFDLADDALQSSSLAESELPLGSRPFEVVLAKRGESKGLDGQPLSTEVLPIPSSHVATARVMAAASGPLSLIESAECKRRWLSTPKYLAGRVETLDDRISTCVERRAAEIVERLVCGTTIEMPARVCDLERRAAETRELMTLQSLTEYIGRPIVSIRSTLAKHAVPFLASFRFTEAGMEKYRVWNSVWELQRSQDHDTFAREISSPPKYGSDDFRDETSEELRGKLDVPTERFISYPGCESDEDKEPIYGWAGWNHLQQAQVIAALYQKRKTEESWAKERLTPMLSGLLDLIPWVKQWHNEPDTEFGGLRLGDYFETFLDGECHALGLTHEDLRAWRPAEKTKGKRSSEKKGSATSLDTDAVPSAAQRRRKKAESHG